jgi:hypothetical protein
VTRGEVSLQSLIALPRVMAAVHQLIRAEHVLLPVPSDAPVLLELGLIDETGAISRKGRSTLKVIRDWADVWDVPPL